MPTPSRLLLLGPLACLVACGGSTPTAGAPTALTTAVTPPAAVTAAPSASPTTAVPPERTTARTDRAMPSGATFTVPANWTIETNGALTVLTGPEPDVKVVLFDSSAKSADDAVLAAWAAFDASWKRPVHISVAAPAREGWEEIKNYGYKTSPDEQLAAGAGAMRKGDVWTVMLIKSGVASADKRSADIDIIGGSVRAKGYTKETFAGKTAHQLDAARIGEITDFIEAGRKQLEIPGVAISLIQGGKVVYEGGFGVKELGRAEKVTPDTLFIIASNTKALTTLLLAKEIDEGKFTWDTPVTQVYPSFKLGDADTTSKVLIKHLVCACTGMPRQDLEMLFEYKSTTADSAIKILGTFQPTTKFGETFQYSNAMATAAGFIAGHVAYPKKEMGAAYDEGMKTKIFDPLGMKSSTFDFATALRRDHATAHEHDIDGHEKPVSVDANRFAVPIRPAGGLWSSVRDMSKYVQMELAKGKLPDGKQLISEANLMERRTPQVAIDETGTYGMGLMTGNASGTPVIHHGGDVMGFHSEMFWLPEHNVGGVILTNGSRGPDLRGAFIRKVKEVLFDGKKEAMEDVESSAKEFKEAIAKSRPLVDMPAKADVVAKLAKHYKNDALGELFVSTKGDHTVFDFGEWKSAVASKKNDDGTTSLIAVDPGAVGVSMVMGERNGKRVLVVRDAQHEYVFSEQ